MGCFSTEDVIAEADVGQDQRQHNYRSDQQQRLRLGSGRGLLERYFKGHYVRPDADGNAQVAGQEYAETQQKRAIFPARVQVPPDHDQ